MSKTLNNSPLPKAQTVDVPENFEVKPSEEFKGTVSIVKEERKEIEEAQNWYPQSRTVLAITPYFFQSLDNLQASNGMVKTTIPLYRGEANIETPELIYKNKEIAHKVIDALFILSKSQYNSSNLIVYSLDDILDKCGYTRRSEGFYHKPENQRIVWDVIKGISNTSISSSVTKQLRTAGRKGMGKYQSVKFYHWFKIEEVLLVGGKRITGITDPTTIEEIPRAIGLRWHEIIASDMQLQTIELPEAQGMERYNFKLNYAMKRKGTRYLRPANAYYDFVTGLGSFNRNNKYKVIKPFREHLRASGLLKEASINSTEAKKRFFEALDVLKDDGRLVNYGWNYNGGMVWRTTPVFNDKKARKALKMSTEFETILTEPPTKKTGQTG